MPKKTDWEQMIENLRGVQSGLEPGNPDILDIEALIQEIRASALGENLGHAAYFLGNPGEKRSLERALRSAAKEFLR